MNFDPLSFKYFDMTCHMQVMNVISVAHVFRSQVIYHSKENEEHLKCSDYLSDELVRT